MLMLGLAMFAVMAGLVFRLVSVHASPDQRILDEVFIPLGVVTVPGPRGAVLDRNGRTVALSLPAATVVADPRLVDDAEKAAAHLGRVLGRPADEILPRLLGDGAFRYVVRQVDPEVGRQVVDLDLAGIDVVNEPRREYPNGRCSGLAAVGRVNIDHVGMSGLEEEYDHLLAGSSGRIVKEVGIDGTTIPGGALEVTEATPGSDLAVTLDRNVQYQTEQLLVEAVAEAGAAQAVALVSVPSTGEIVAMANVARHRDGIVDCTRHNLAATWTYEPGSVLKPVTLAAALSSGVVVEDAVITVPSALTIWGHRFEDTPWHEEVELSLTDILTRSSNVGTIKVARIAGERQLHSTLSAFGFGQRTALGFKGESKGLFPPLKEWNGLSLPTFAIGQGLSITPLQLLQVYNTIANDGVLVPLRLVSDDSVAHIGQRVRIIDSSTASSLMSMLTNVVAAGTGRRAALPGFAMAGKTGTAWQPCDVGYSCVNERKEFIGRHHTASFAGVVTNDEGAAIVVLVVIDQPIGQRVSGGYLSAPVVSRVAEYALRQLRIPVMSDTEPDERVRADPAPFPTLPPVEDGDGATDGAGAET